MRTFEQAKGLVHTILEDAGLVNVPIAPGPNLPDYPGQFVVLTRYGGDGFELDTVFDGIGWQVRVASPQSDYSTGETVADTIDRQFASRRPGKIGDLWVTGIQRVGGAPNPLMLDDADRTHFVCSYMASVESALAN